MQAATYPQNAPPTASPGSKASPVSGAINGRQATSAPAASPRISCHSPWWSALWQGGFKGLYKWLVRTQEDKRLSVQERQNKHRQAETAISIALAQAASNQEINAAEFNKLVKDARWYDIDVDQVIHSAFLTSRQDSLEKIKSACDGKKTLGWLVRKIDGKLEELKALEKKLKDVIYKLTTLSAEGFPVNGPSQKPIWEEMDQSFDAVGSCHLEGHVAFALSEAGAWNLLPYAELQFKSVATTSKVLEQICIQAWKNILAAKTIDFSRLTDAELSRFLALVKHPDLKRHASACKEEKERRARNAKFEQLAAHFKKRAQGLATSSPITPQTDANTSGAAFLKGMSTSEISRIALRVIVKLNVVDVLEISKLKSENLPDIDLWLHEIAKAQLEKPAVTLMEDAVLIDYLKLADGKLHDEVIGRLEAEAGKRARKAYEESYARLQAGLQSDSCNELVSAALEFSARFKLAEQLDSVSILDETRAKPDASFVKIVKELKDHQKIRARNLVLKLRALGQSEAANHLSSVIGPLRGTALVQLNDREEQQIADALSQYVPAVSDAISRTLATPTGIELGKKFLGLFNAYILNDADFRRVRNVEDGELPVSAQFVMDQRSSDLQVEGRPVFIRHIPFPMPNDTRRAQEFIKRMRAVKGISDDQIMSASRIASQSAGAVLGILARNEKLFSLTDDEAVAAQVGSARPGLMVSGIEHKESFVLNRDGSLTVNARLFKENAGFWSGGSSSPGKNDLINITTDPEKSSFFAELRFEIDKKGGIQEVVFVKWAIERANARKLDDAYGAA